MLLMHSEKTELAAFRKHSCVGVSFVFNLYLFILSHFWHAKMLKDTHQMTKIKKMDIRCWWQKDMEQLECSSIVGGNQNGLTILQNFGKLGSLL